MEIKLLLIESVSTVGLEKQILLQTFFHQFSVPIPFTEQERKSLQETFPSTIDELKISDSPTPEIEIKKPEGNFREKVWDLLQKVTSQLKERSESNRRLELEYVDKFIDEYQLLEEGPRRNDIPYQLEFLQC